jgi:hypothetical protein
MELHDVVLKLVGPVKAVGETHEDNKRLANIKALTELVDRLLYTISDASVDACRHETAWREPWNSSTSDWRDCNRECSTHGRREGERTPAQSGQIRRL